MMIAPKSESACNLLATGIPVDELLALIPVLEWTTCPPPPGQPAMYEFSQAFHDDRNTEEHNLQMLLGIMRQCGRYIGYPTKAHTMLDKLPPGHAVYPHCDHKVEWLISGRHVRHHLVIQAAPGATFTLGKQTIEHRAGDLWQIEGAHNTPHFAVNGGNIDRIIAVFDVPRPSPKFHITTGVKFDG